MGGYQDATLTVAFAMIAGVACSILGERLKISSLFFYLIVGVLLGPSGIGFLQPAALGQGLEGLVSIGVAIILFEGAIQLDFRQVREMRRIIRNLLTAGVAITLLGGTLAAYCIAHVRWELAVLYGAVMTVTGPTVIRPILRRVPLKKPLGAILHWESVLIDPIGAILAVFLFELVVSERFSPGLSVFTLGQAIVVGGLCGGIIGLCYAESLRRRIWAHGEQRNIGAIATALLIYAVSEYLVPNAGLIAVVIGGLVVGWRADREREEILRFKGALVTLLLSTLFILLSANLVIRNIVELGHAGLLVVAIMLFVVRPLAVFISTQGAGLPWNERAFLALVAPRGIIAASIASLFTFTLQGQGWSDAEALESLTYLTIASTVLLQGLPAGLIARILRVRGTPRSGFLIIGCHPLARCLAKWLRQQGIEVRLLDTDLSAVIEARQEGFVSYYGNAIDEADMERLDIQDVGKVLALTSNDEVNILACQLGGRIFGRQNIFRPGELREITTPRGVIARVGGRRVFPGLPRVSVTLAAMREGRGECSVRIASDAIEMSSTSISGELFSIPLAYRLGTSIRLIEVHSVIPKGAEVLWLDIEAS